jgi:hypothetical protein
MIPGSARNWIAGLQLTQVQQSNPKQQKKGHSGAKFTEEKPDAALERRVVAGFHNYLPQSNNNIPKSTGHEPDLLLEIAHLLLIV